MAVSTSESKTAGAFAGNLGQASSAPKGVAKHVCEQTFCKNLGKVGATAAHILLFRAHADMTIKRCTIMPALAHTATANSPDIGLSKSSTDAGSLTVLGTPKDGTSGNYVARTGIDLSLASTAVSAGDYVWGVVATNGTPANKTGELALEVEYELND